MCLAFSAGGTSISKRVTAVVTVQPRVRLKPCFTSSSLRRRASSRSGAAATRAAHRIKKRPAQLADRI
jgi:hypothetical protein